MMGDLPLHQRSGRGPCPWHHALASLERAELLPPSSYQPHAKWLVCIGTSDWSLLRSYALWGLPTV